MTPDLHPDMDDLILFCLGTPAGAPESKEDAAVIARVRVHLQQCPECSAEAAQLRADFALVAMSVPQIPPPASAKERLMQAAGVSSPQPASRHSIKTFPKPTRDGSSHGIAAVPVRRTNPALIWGGWVAAVALPVLCDSRSRCEPEHANIAWPLKLRS